MEIETSLCASLRYFTFCGGCCIFLGGGGQGLFSTYGMSPMIDQAPELITLELVIISTKKETNHKNMFI